MDWLLLILAFLLGMLVEWLLEMWYFRRRFRTEYDAKEREFNAKLSARDKELADLRAQVEALQGNVNTLTESKTTLESNLTASENSRAEARAQIEKLQADLSAATSAKAAAEDRLRARDQELQARDKEFGELKANLLALRPGEEKDKEVSIAGLAALAAGAATAAATIKSKDDALNAANARVNELQANVDALAASKADLESALQQRESELADLNTRFAAIQSDFDKAKQAAAVELAALTSGAAAAAAAIKSKEADLNVANARLASLQEEAGALASARESLEATARTLGANLAEARNHLIALEAEYDESRTLSAVELASLTTRVLAVQDKLKSKDEALDEAYRRNVMLRDELRALDRTRISAELSAQDRDRQLEEVKTRFAALQDTFDKTRSESAIELAALAAGGAATTATIKDKEGALDEAYRQVAALQNELHALQSLKVDTDATLRMHEKALADAQMEIANLRSTMSTPIAELEAKLQERDRELLSMRARLNILQQEFDRSRGSSAQKMATLAANAIAAEEEIKGRTDALAGALEQIEALQTETGALKDERESALAALQARENELTDARAQQTLYANRIEQMKKAGGQ